MHSRKLSTQLNQTKEDGETNEDHEEIHHPSSPEGVEQGISLTPYGIDDAIEHELSRRIERGR
jgi:hypothetical protein